MPSIRYGLVCLAALGLSACAGLPATSVIEAEQAVRLGPPLEHFVADGRILLKTGERRDHLRFRWERTRVEGYAVDVVLFMSPLGQGLAELTQDAAGARLVRPHQPPLRAANLAELTERVFGVPLPLETLVDWLRGARPELSGAVDGWQVRVTDTVPYRQRRLLRTMEVSRDDTELTLLVDEWDGGDE